MPENAYNRREFITMLAGGLAGAAALRAAGAEPASSRPNILLLMSDQHRGDCVGRDGNSVIRTPNLDRLAKEGVWFRRAYSSTPTCTPARAALLTGQNPWNHGMLGYAKVAERYPFEIWRAMNDAGYFTQAIGKLHYHPQRNYHGFQAALIDESGRVESPGFVSDYRQWFKKQAPDKDPDVTGIGFNDYRAREYALPEELHPTRWTGDRAVEFLRDYKRPEPFLLKVSFARPHSPYDPPKRFTDMYREQDMPAPHVGDWAARYAPLGAKDDFNRWHGDVGLAETRRSRRGYFGAVSFIDEQIGRIITELKARDLLEKTLILYIADHGEMTGDHHLWRKSYAYEASARIPMMIRWPESLKVMADRGEFLSQPVEIRDIAPTLLDAAGAKVPESVEGSSLLDLLRGKASGWREFIDLEHDFCYAAENHWNALTDGRWKYIYHAFDGREQLFDLGSDPGETRDLAPSSAHASTLKDWRRRMVEHLAERGEKWVKDGKLVPRPQRILHSPNYPGI